MATSKVLSEVQSSAMVRPLEQISHNLNIAKQCLRYISDQVLDQSKDLRSRYKNIPQEIEEKIKLHNEFSYYDTSSDLLKITLELIHNLEINTNRATEKSLSNIIEKIEKETDIEDRLEKQFNQTLVDLMIVSIECWERNTGKDRLTLAEESRLWRITIDNGQLRVRTMNRYLNIKTLPKHPRWKTVLATGNFVYKHADPNLDISYELKKVIDYSLETLRKRALI